MGEIEKAFVAHSERLKKLLAKHNAGKPLSAEELQLIGAAARAEALPPKAAGMEHAVALLEAQFPQLTKPLLKQLKKTPEFKACFDGANRVLLPPLVTALTNYFASKQTPAAAARRTPMEKHDLECRKLAAEAEKKEFELEQHRGQYVKRADVIKSNRQLANELQKLFRRDENEGPAAVAGKDLEEARAWFKRRTDATLRLIAGWSDQWPE